MTDAYHINVPGFDQANANLKTQLDRIAQIIENITKATNQMSTAQEGSPFRAWADNHTTWNSRHTEAQEAANAIYAAAIRVRQDFSDGDLAGTRIMLQWS